MTSYYQVDVDAIAERHIIKRLDEAVNSLAEIVKEWVSAGTVSEVEWIRMRSLDFQEAFRARNELVQRLDQYSCTLCGNFEHHVGFS